MMKQKMSFWKIADWLEKHLIYQFGMMREQFVPGCSKVTGSEIKGGYYEKNMRDTDTFSGPEHAALCRRNTL